MKQFPGLINSILTYIQLHDVKGKYRFYLITRQLFKHFVLRYQVGKKTFYVPYDQWCFWCHYGPNNYYLDEMLPFANMINQKLSTFDFIDLGADIGTVSALMKKHCQAFNQVIAVEPNPSSFNILQQNLMQNAWVFNCAVSDFNGHCQFNMKSQQSSDHEGYIDPFQIGKTPVYSLDTLIEEKHIILADEVVIKIDVEGQEQAVFKGAKHTIQTAKKVMVLLELHPDTLKRDKLTPELIFQQANQLANFTWFVPLLNNAQVDINQKFFEQFPLQQYDVIGYADNTKLY